MRYYREPDNFERLHKNYLVIGYFQGKAIVKDELHKLYFIECEENIAPIGTIAEENILEPAEVLSMEEQADIREIYGNKGL